MTTNPELTTEYLAEETLSSEAYESQYTPAERWQLRQKLGRTSLTPQPWWPDGGEAA